MRGRGTTEHLGILDDLSWFPFPPEEARTWAAPVVTERPRAHDVIAIIGGGRLASQAMEALARMHIAELSAPIAYLDHDVVRTMAWGIDMASGPDITVEAMIGEDGAQAMREVILRREEEMMIDLLSPDTKDVLVAEGSRIMPEMLIRACAFKEADFRVTREPRVKDWENRQHHRYGGKRRKRR